MNKRVYFISLFLAVHVLIVVLQIHKQSSLIKLSYEKQRLEKEHRELLAQHDALTQKLSKLQDHESVKKYALSTLNMKHISLNQIRHTNDAHPV